MSDKIAPYCKPWVVLQAPVSFGAWLAHYFLPVPWALVIATGIAWITAASLILVLYLTWAIGYLLEGKPDKLENDYFMSVRPPRWIFGKRERRRQRLRRIARLEEATGIGQSWGSGLWL